MTDSRLRPAARFWIAWACWSMAQVATLAVFALRLPLAAKVPPPIEQFAIAGVAATQFAGIALMASALLGRAGRPDIVAATALPLMALAALMAGLPLQAVLIVIAIDLLWIAALSATMAMVRPARLGRALLVVACILLPLAAYARYEFGPAPSTDLHFGLATASPTMGMTTIGFHPTIKTPLGALPILILGLATLFFCLRRFRLKHFQTKRMTRKNLPHF